MRIKWEPRDIWVGLYWTVRKGMITVDSPPNGTGQTMYQNTYYFYLCIVPCFPICWEVQRNKPVRA